MFSPCVKDVEFVGLKMSKNKFRNKVSDFREALVEAGYKSKGKIVFYFGDKEFGAFSVFTNFSDTDSSFQEEYEKLLICLSTKVGVRFSISQNKESAVLYTGIIDKLTINMKISKLENSMFVKFAVIGKDLTSDTTFEKYSKVKVGSVFSVNKNLMSITDFFQIVRRSGETVYIKRLKTDFKNGKMIPVTNSFVSEEVIKSTISGQENSPVLSVKSVSTQMWK